MEKENNLLYRNITISGRVAVGSTTLFNNLKQKLSPLGWNFFSAGEFMRAYAIKKGLISENSVNHHSAAIYSDNFDRQVDEMMRKRLSEENNLVIEADLAGFMARGIPRVLKILLICDDALRIDRLVNREHITIQEAKKHIKIRESENIMKWKRLYGDYDFWDPSFYDLVIDTYRHSPSETLDLVLKKIGHI